MAEKTFHSITLPGQDTARVPLTAAEFSTSVAYKVKDYCTYQGKLYRCTTAHAAGAWNAAHFTETDVDAEFDRKLDIPVSQASAPANPRVGDLWIDNDENSPIYNVDASPTLNSTNAVQSGGTKVALNSLDSRKMEHGVITGDFSASVDYRVGDLVFYATTANGITTRTLYRCTTDHDTAAWNPAHFTATTLEVELQRVRDNEADTDMIGDLFGTKTTYAVGDYCIYNDNLYRCIKAVDNTGATTPAFDPDDWTQVALANDVSDLKSAIEKLDGGRTRNLINPANYYEVPYTGAGITATVLDDGSIKVVGTPAIYLVLILIKSNTVSVPNGSYTLTIWENDVRKSITHSTVTNGYMPQITLSFPSGTAVDSTYKIQFESGNLGTDFIPYSTVIDYIAREDISNLEKSVGNGTAINNNVITPNKTTFVVEHQSVNLFNPTTMATVGAWVINSNGIATKESDQYTTNYGTLIIPVSGITAVSIKCASPYTRIYNWFYTDDAGTIITSATPITEIVNGYTITPLDGTGTMLWMSISGYRTTSEGYMIVEGTTAQDYQPYSYYLTIPDLQNEKLHILKCPSQYTAVVGDTLQIFYKGLVESVYDDSYDVIIRCDIGKAFERYYQVTPVSGDIGTHNITISVYTPDHSTLIGTDTISLNVVAKMASPASNAVILYVGDSLAVNGQVPHEFKRRLTGNGGTPSGDGLNNITFIGSKSYDGVNFEGIGGWTFNLYNSEGAVEDTNMIITCVNNGKTQDDQHSIYKDTNNTQWKLETIETDQITIIRVSSSGTLPSTGTLTWVSGGINHDVITYTGSERAPGNPFWDSSENKVDFGTYATRMGVSSIDYVYVLLGWNGGAITETTYKAAVTTFINNVKTSFPNAKVVLMGLEIPARDGLATNYSANDIYSDYYAMLDRVFMLNQWYAEIAENTENVYFLNISGQFDSKYNMQTSTRNVNTRNSTTETFQSNGVHPATSGYMQIADACYRHFNWLNMQ